MACCSCLGPVAVNWDFLVSPQAQEQATNIARSYGTLVSGAFFGAAWWVWADACALSTSKVPGDQYIPGIIATLAIIMINCIRREELQEADPWDDAAGFCRPRFWLFLSYCVSFSSVIGAVWVMVEHYGSNTDLTAADKWPGAAGILQVVLILGSGLLLFVSRTPSEDAGSSYGGYAPF